MIKKLIAVSLAIVMLASLAACGGSSNNATTTTAGGQTEAAPTQAGDNNESVAPTEGSEPSSDMEVFFDNIDDSITVSKIKWFRDDITAYTTAEGTVTKKTPEGTVVFATSGNIQGAYPVTNQQENIWCFNVYESLFQRNYETGEIDPWLCTDYSFDDDGNMHLTLREGVKFHDGNTMTAEDVLYTLELSKTDAKARAYSIMQNIDFEKCTIEDDYHLTLVFSSPIGSILDVLASGYCSIMSKEFVEKVGPDYAYTDADAGTGAYQLVETVTDLSQTFKRFDEYWGGAPEVETVICKKYSDETVMFIDFLNCDLDFTFRVSYNDLQDILAGQYTDMTLFRIPNNRYKYIYMNTNNDRSPCTDVRVREAIAHAINYDDLAIAVYGSDAIADGQMDSSLMEGMSYKISAGKYEYDPELAKQLLADAGYSDSNPCVINMVAGSNNHLDEIAELVQFYLQDIGMQVSVDVLKSSALKDQTTGSMEVSEYDLVFNTGDFGNGSPTGIYSTRDAYGREVGKFNPITGIVDEEFHNKFIAAEAAPTEEERAAIYADIQHMFFDNVWCINTLADNQMAAGHKWLQNYNFSSGYTFRWADWTLAE